MNDDVDDEDARLADAEAAGTEESKKAKSEARRNTQRLSPSSDRTRLLLANSLSRFVSHIRSLAPRRLSRSHKITFTHVHILSHRTSVVRRKFAWLTSFFSLSLSLSPFLSRSLTVQSSGEASRGEEETAGAAAAAARLVQRAQGTRGKRGREVFGERK